MVRLGSVQIRQKKGAQLSPSSKEKRTARKEPTKAQDCIYVLLYVRNRKRFHKNQFIFSGVPEFPTLSYSVRPELYSVPEELGSGLPNGAGRFLFPSRPWY